MADAAHTQVLIAGAVPTGLMLAAQLARHGVALQAWLSGTLGVQASRRVRS